MAAGPAAPLESALIRAGGRRWRLAVLLALAASLPAVGSAGESSQPAGTPAGPAFEVEMRPLPDGVRKVWIEEDAGGAPWYVLEHLDGGRERVRPDELAARLAADRRHRSLVYRILNITSPIGFAWVALGLLGQVLFTGRMIVQWLTSERARRSVVPVGFWWMSLAGASMLLAYFVWRRDIVGALGQSAGWIIYGRNLWLIYHPPDHPVQG